MSDLMEFTGLDEIVGKLNAFSDEAKTDIKQLYGAVGSATLIDAQSLAPVDRGDLRDSGHMDATDGVDTFEVEVTFGDGNGYGAKYGDADGYSWFQELGTKNIPAHPYLGPSFDQHSIELENDLKDLLS